MDESNVAMEWVEFGEDVVAMALPETEPTLCQVFMLIERGHFPGQED